MLFVQALTQSQDLHYFYFVRPARKFYQQFCVKFKRNNTLIITKDCTVAK
jgi:hypothetical protein